VAEGKPPDKETCEQLLEQVKNGEVDPSSPQAQQLLMLGLMKGWISRKDADAAADAYWDARVLTVLEEVAAGNMDPTFPETEWLLDWGVKTKRITQKQRRAAIKSFKETAG
jgi:hypothetical protein